MLVLHLSEYLSLLLLTWGYHVYAYILGATPNTVKLDLNGGILPFAFSYKDDEDNVKHGYAC
jgi:hypothetical protein